MKDKNTSAGTAKFDPMASLLEDILRPRIVDLQREGVRSWSTLFSKWAVEEAGRDTPHDTIRIERLVETTWDAAKKAVGGWDSRFALQVLRTLPNPVVGATCQLRAPTDLGSIVSVIRTMTAAAVHSDGNQWARIRSQGETGIAITEGQLDDLVRDAPRVIGGCIGACNLNIAAQNWYRWAGKGARIADPLSPVDLEQMEEAVRKWQGDSIILLPAIRLESDREVQPAVQTYEKRKDGAGALWSRTGMSYDHRDKLGRGRWDSRFYSTIPTGGLDALPVYIPGLDITFPSPDWFALPDTGWVEAFEVQVRPFEDELEKLLGLEFDELVVGLRAISLVVERHTQCGFLKLEEPGDNRIALESPADGEVLEGVAHHLASLLLRGYVRTHRRDFESALSGELGGLGIGSPESLATRITKAFTGKPDPISFSDHILFYEIDDDTFVLDLLGWGDFLEGLTLMVTSGEGDVANVRGDLFEEQVRRELRDGLELEDADVPYDPNRDVVTQETNYGDVDFCFVQHGVLVNLDMKSWRRTRDYHIGHYHTISDRLDTLETQLGRVTRRGQELERQIGHSGGRLDLLIVAYPEYIAPNRASLWMGEVPRVLTARELIELVKEEGKLVELAEAKA